MPDTDSRMMRRQQDKDTPERIEGDETRPAPQAKDSDPESGKDREAAKRNETTQANEQMDAVFNENKREGGGEEPDKFMEDVATDGQGNLIDPGRSLLNRRS